MPANKESTESKENQLLPVSTLLQNTTTSRKLHLATLLFTSLQVNPFQNKDGEPVKLTHLTSWSEGGIPRSTVIFYYGQLGLWKASPWSAEQLTRCHVSVHQALRTVMRNTHEKEAPSASRSSSTAHVPPNLNWASPNASGAAPKTLFAASIKSWESTSGTRDSSSCSALEALRESKQLSLYEAFMK